MVECHGGQSFQVGNGRGGSYHHFRFPLIPGNQTSRRTFCFISCLKPEVVVNWYPANKHKPYLLTCLFPSLDQFLHLLVLDTRRKRVSSFTIFVDCHLGHLQSGTPYTTWPPAFGSRQGIAPNNPINCVCITAKAFAVSSEETDAPGDDAFCLQALAKLPVFCGMQKFAGVALLPRFQLIKSMFRGNVIANTINAAPEGEGMRTRCQPHRPTTSNTHDL